MVGTYLNIYNDKFIANVIFNNEKHYFKIRSNIMKSTITTI